MGREADPQLYCFIKVQLRLQQIATSQCYWEEKRIPASNQEITVV